jgi:single-stranded-DNA-specific exonuclease
MGISNVTDTEALRAALRAHPWPPGIGLRELKIDAVCDLGDLNSRLLDSLRLLEPTGKGNPTPLFALSGVRVDEAKIDQKSGRHVFLRLTDVQTGRTIRAPWFFRADQAPAPGSIVDVAGRPTLNDFAGRTSIEFMVVAVRPTEAVMPRTIRDAA